MIPVTIVYFCYGWTLWLYLTWLPSYFLHEYQYDLKKSALFTSAVFFAGVVGDYLGGEVSDRILHRTGSLQSARRNMVMIGFAGSFVCLLPVFLTHDLMLIILSLGAAFFFAELVIGPMWSIPMDIAGKFSGNRRRHDEHRFGAGRDPVADRLRLHHRQHRQLAAAVRRIARVSPARSGSRAARCIPSGRSKGRWSRQRIG